MGRGISFSAWDHQAQAHGIRWKGALRSGLLNLYPSDSEPNLINVYIYLNLFLAIFNFFFIYFYDVFLGRAPGFDEEEVLSPLQARPAGPVIAIAAEEGVEALLFEGAVTGGQSIHFWQIEPLCQGLKA